MYKITTRLLIIVYLVFVLAACRSSEIPTQDAPDSEAETIITESSEMADSSEQSKGGMHDLAVVAAELNVTEKELMAALGDPSQGIPDFAAAAEALGVTEEALQDAMAAGEIDTEATTSTSQDGSESAPDDCGLGEDGYPESGCEVPVYTFDDAPVDMVRWDASDEFTLANGETHTYEVVYLPEGGINWVQARYLAEEAGGYLATVTSDEEAEFLLSLVQDEKYWFQWDETHNYIMNGPFLGGYQPEGSDEPDGNWLWVSGEPFEYTNWAYDGMPGDEDSRPNDQPNDATGNQNVIALGEVNIPVSTWGDFPYRLSSYNDPNEGGAYGFIIEYDQSP